MKTTRTAALEEIVGAIKYKERLGISRSTPLSDGERLDFEERVIPWLKEHSHEKGTT